MSEERSQDQSRLVQFYGDLLDVQTDDPVRQRRGRLVNLVLLIALGIALLWLVFALFSMQAAPGIGTVGRLVLMVFILGVTYTLNRRSASPLAGLILSLASLAGSVLALLASGPFTTYVISLTVPVLIAGLLGPPASAFLVATLAALAYGWLNVQHNPSYLAELTMGGGADTFIVYMNLYIIAALGWLFSRMAGRAIRENHAEIQALLKRQEGLEALLDRQRVNLRATANVAREVATTREEDAVLSQSVRLVHQYFRYDVVQIFMVDEVRGEVVLRASTSQAGHELLARGHSLPIGSQTAVGRAADWGEPVVGDEKKSADLLLQKVEHSPDIRSEAAVPLTVGDRVIGVLHLQSIQSGTFDDSDMTMLQALADQLAVAIANARVFEETHRNLRELGELSREATQRGWRTYLFEKTEGDRIYRHGPSDDARWVARQEAIVEQVVKSGKTVFAQAEQESAPSYVAVPLILRSEVIGVVGVETDGVRHWTQDDVVIMQSIAERTTLAVENARLFEQAHRTAQREQLINTIASRLQRAPTLRMLLEGVASELSEALGTDQVYAEFALHESAMAADGDVPEGDRNVVSEQAQPGEESDLLESSDGSDNVPSGLSPNGDEAAGQLGNGRKSRRKSK
jgi:GAF domain-containing protein